MTIETKYDIGQRVWYIDQPISFSRFEPVEMEIEEIQFNTKDGVVYKMKEDKTKPVARFKKENKVCSTKEELLQSL